MGSARRATCREPGLPLWLGRRGRAERGLQQRVEQRPTIRGRRWRVGRQQSGCDAAVHVGASGNGGCGLDVHFATACAGERSIARGLHWRELQLL